MTMLASFAWPSLVHVQFINDAFWLSTVANFLETAPKVRTILVEYDGRYPEQSAKELECLQGKTWSQLLNLCIVAKEITHDVVDVLKVGCPNSTIHLRAYLPDKAGYYRYGVSVPAEHQGICKVC
jgi:hypothetical protein